jgi:hypothetical protein
MTTTPNDPVGDDDIETVRGATATPMPGGDADSTDADATDGDSTDATDGDSTDGGDADGTDA